MISRCISGICRRGFMSNKGNSCVTTAIISLGLFKTVGIPDLRIFSSDHFALHARLIWRPTRYNSQYLLGIQALPLHLLQIGPQQLVDAKF